MKSSLLIFFSAMTLILPLQAQIELKPGDHIAILGNALPDRSQHYGWL